MKEIKKRISPPPPPQEKIAVVRYYYAIGRKFNFSFYLCSKRARVEELVREAFQHVEEIWPHVHTRHYDLLGPDYRITAHSARKTAIEPGMKIAIHMWPWPEPKEQTIPPPPLDVISSLDDMLGPKKKPKGG